MLLSGWRQINQQCRCGHDFLNFGTVSRRGTTLGPVAYSGGGGTDIGQMIGWIESRAHAFKAQVSDDEGIEKERTIYDADDGKEYLVWVILRFVFHWYWSYRIFMAFPVSL